jgi:hypothetical protein
MGQHLLRRWTEMPIAVLGNDLGKPVSLVESKELSREEVEVDMKVLIRGCVVVHSK